MKCYFCNNKLSGFIPNKEDPGDYHNYYTCYRCPRVDPPYLNYNIFKWPFTIALDVNQITEYLQYVFLDKLKVWLVVDHRSTSILDKKTQLIIEIPQRINIYDFTPEILTNKVHTWIVFS